MQPTAQRKPEGGFQFISVAHLCAVWCAYESRRLRLHDVRLWCAAQEMLARRCQLTAGQQPVYRHDELHSLTGGRGGITAALARLQTNGLLTWATSALTFPSPVIEANTPLATMLAKIPNQHRRIPVPRRLLRFLAKGCSRVLLATILGHLFRCLYYRQGQCRAEGFCKASWIADVFGVSPRAVKTARQRLEALGFLQRTETPQWVRNRYGQKMTINLQWEGTLGVPSGAQTPAREIAPPPALLSSEIAPPDSDRQLLTEQNHQNPACGAPTGVLSTLFAQAQACLRNGTSLLEEPDPSEGIPAVTAAPHVQTLPVAVQPPPLPPPRLQHVLVPDLHDLARLLLLYTQAVQAQLVDSSEAARLNFVALAQHVLRFQPKNPGGLFLQLLRHRRFAVITQAEEDHARRRLNTYLYARPGGETRSLAA
jgi:hypothetical protein